MFFFECNSNLPLFTRTCLKVAKPTMRELKSSKYPARPYGCLPLYHSLALRPIESLLIDQDQKSSIVIILQFEFIFKIK